VQPARGPAISTVPALTPDRTNTDPNSTPVCDTELDTISDKPRDTTPLQQNFLRLLLNKNRSANPSRTVYWPGDRYSPPQHKGTSSSTHHKHSCPSTQWERRHHNTAASSRPLRTQTRPLSPDIYHNRHKVAFHGCDIEMPLGGHHLPRPASPLDEFFSVVNVEHTATLTITCKGSNIQHLQIITTIVMKVVTALTICGPYVHLIVIKIMSPMVTIINLFLSNTLTNRDIRLPNL